MKGPILLWMLLFGVCGVVGYLADIGWMMVVGGIGVVLYIFVWRSNVTTLHLAIDNQWKPHEVLALIKEGADIGQEINRATRLCTLRRDVINR